MLIICLDENEEKTKKNAQLWMIVVILLLIFLFVYGKVLGIDMVIIYNKDFFITK